MLLNRLKFLPMALAISAIATGAAAEGDHVTHVTHVSDDSTYAAAAATTKVEPVKPAPSPWDFANIPKEGPAILVNIPSYELIAFRDGKPVLRSKVIVGKRGTPTPIKRTKTSVVRFRPFWTPTRDMIRRGTRPGTRSPGRRNPLGLLAVRLERGSLIYLHGTNKPHLFKRKHRSLSNGCVRVEKWDQVAAFVLNTTINEIHKHANGRRTFDKQTNHVPVIFGYYTSFPDADGNLQDYRDIYYRGRSGPKSRVAAKSKRKAKARNTAKARTKTKVRAKARAKTKAKARSTIKTSNIKKAAAVRTGARPIGPGDRTFKLQ